MTRPRVIDVLRSIVFYLVFYPGTLFFIAAVFLALPFRHLVLRRMVWGWSRFHRGCVNVLLGIRVEVIGTVPPAGVLIAAKHESFFEAIDLPLLFGTPAIFAKAELLRIPLWGKAAEVYGLIPVERDQGARALRAMLRAAQAEVAAGRPLVIFPEGTRVPHGTRPALQSGFAGLYKLLGLAVVPVAVDSGPPYHRRWKRPGVIRILIGEPIPPGLPREEVEARVNDAINVLNRGDPPADPR